MEAEMGVGNPVREKSYGFALGVIRLSRVMNEQREYLLARQVLRSGTGIGANVEEALAGQSRADFLSKMSIASKEARECHYWLRLVRDGSVMPRDAVERLIDDCDELARMLTSIAKTTAKPTDPIQNSTFKIHNNGP